MDIWFGDDDTAELCSRTTSLTARWGPKGGMAVGRRLLQIEAAPTVTALQKLPGDLRQDATDGTWMINASDVVIIKFELDDGAAGAQTIRVLSVSDRSAERKRR